MKKTIGLFVLLAAAATAQTFDPATYGTPGVVPNFNASGPVPGPGAMHLWGRVSPTAAQPFLFELTGLPSGYAALVAPSNEMVAFVIDVGASSGAVTSIGGADFYLPLNSPVVNFIPFLLDVNNQPTASTITYLGPGDMTPVTSQGGSQAPLNRTGAKWAPPLGWYMPGIATFSVQAVMLNTVTGALFTSNAVNFS